MDCVNYFFFITVLFVELLIKLEDIDDFVCFLVFDFELDNDDDMYINVIVIVIK